jgi:hypothetical protein
MVEEGTFEVSKHANTLHQPSELLQCFAAVPATNKPASTLQPKSSTGTLYSRSNNLATDDVAHRTLETRSVKTRLSIESFKSVVSILESTKDSYVSQDINAIRNVLHAFRTAAANISCLIQRRLPQSNDIQRAAISLQRSLAHQESTIDEIHTSHCKRLGSVYLKMFNTSETRKFTIMLYLSVSARSIWEMSSLLLRC